MAVAGRRRRRDAFGGEGVLGFGVGLFPPNTVGGDRVLSEFFYTSRMPPNAEVLYETSEGDKTAVIWRWRHGPVTVYGLDARLCGNNIVSLRSFDPGAVEFWMAYINSVFDLLGSLSIECVAPNAVIPNM